MTPRQAARLPYRPCAGVMLVNKAGQVFVGRRRDNHKAAWQMPQGGIDPGEHPRAAALRELWEETSISADRVTIEAEMKEWLCYDLPADLVGKIWQGRYRGQTMKWFLMRFNGTDDDINIETEQPEFSAWRWCDLGALCDHIVPFKRDVYEQVLAEFRERL